MNQPLTPTLLIGNNTATEPRKELEDSGLFEIIPASIGKFVSGEPFTELHKGGEVVYAQNLARLKGARVYVLQSTSEPVADSFQHLLLMAHTLKYYGAADVTAICPFAAGLRQDRAFKDRFTSVAAVLFAQQMKAAGIDGDRWAKCARGARAIAAGHAGDHRRVHAGADGRGDDGFDAGGGTGGGGYRAAGGWVVGLVDQGG